MSNIAINKLTNCNVYVDGVSYMGRVEEFDVPELNFKMAAHKALGLFGEFELPSGLDKLEARCKWSSLYPDALGTTGNPYKARQIMVRGSLEVYTSGGRTDEQPVTFTMTAQPKNLPGAKFKQQDNVELETKFTVTYCKLEVNNEVVFEVDVLANICTVGGEDILAQFRANA